MSRKSAICMYHGGSRGSYVTQDAYRAAKHKPDFDALPWEAEYRAANQKA